MTRRLVTPTLRGCRTGTGAERGRKPTPVREVGVAHGEAQEGPQRVGRLFRTPAGSMRHANSPDVLLTGLKFPPGIIGLETNLLSRSGFGSNVKRSYQRPDTSSYGFPVLSRVRMPPLGVQVPTVEPGPLKRVRMQLLLIEDDASVARGIRKGLEREGHGVDVAATGSEGLAMARDGDHDVIILDVMLPDQTGFDVAAVLRSEGYAAPILMLTALASTDDVVHGLDAGADDYLTKPFELDELRARVRALTRRTQTNSAGVLRFADIEVDTRERRVLRAGESIRLTELEFQVLLALIQRPGHTVSRRELLEGVWGIHFDPRTRLVDVHVANLRKKLEAAGGGRVISTVRMVGYRLVWPGMD